LGKGERSSSSIKERERCRTTCFLRPVRNLRAKQIEEKKYDLRKTKNLGGKKLLPKRARKGKPVLRKKGYARWISTKRGICLGKEDTKDL